MIAAADFEAYARAVDVIVQAASDYVERSVLEWAAANLGASTAKAREAAKAIMAQAGEAYGQAAATLAAEWYDERAQAAHAKLPCAVTEAVYDEKLADSTARYQARKYAAGDVEGFASSCAALARDSARRCVNGTVMANVERDSEKGARFARVPVGTTTCAFCLMLASRGAVYSSRRSAGDGNRFHRNCDCKVVPSWDNNPDAILVEGFDPNALYHRLKLVERQTGLKFGDEGDMAELNRLAKIYSDDWLTYGIKSKVEYASATVEERAAPHEKRTAERLAAKGVATRFIQDYEWVVGADGVKRKVGLPDFESGVEIKTLMDSRNAYGALSNYLASSSGKKGLTCVVVDNSESQFIEDSDILGCAPDVFSDYEKVPVLMVLLKSGELVRIKRKAAVKAT